MVKVNFKKLYESRIEEIDEQIRTMAKRKCFKGYKALKEEKKNLLNKIEGMK